MTKPCKPGECVVKERRPNVWMCFLCDRNPVEEALKKQREDKEACKHGTGQMSIKKININPPDAEVIEYLEHCLGRAKNGEIQSVLVIGSRGDSITFNGMVGIHKNTMAIVGEIEVAKLDVIGLMVELRCDTQQLISQLIQKGV